jgi:hypothetical protein
MLEAGPFAVSAKTGVVDDPPWPLRDTHRFVVIVATALIHYSSAML